MTDLGLCNDALFDSAILHKMCFCSCSMCKNKSFLICTPKRQIGYTFS